MRHNRNVEGSSGEKRKIANNVPVSLWESSQTFFTQNFPPTRSDEY